MMPMGLLLNTQEHGSFCTYLCRIFLFAESLKLTREINDYNILKSSGTGDVATMNDQENFDTVMVSERKTKFHIACPVLIQSSFFLNLKNQ